MLERNQTVSGKSGARASEERDLLVLSESISNSGLLRGKRLPGVYLRISKNGESEVRNGYSGGGNEKSWRYLYVDGVYTFSPYRRLIKDETSKSIKHVSRRML